MTKALLGRPATAEAEGIGHSPTDRGKHGTKRSTLSEGHGLPLAVVVAGANVHDLKLAASTLDALIVERPAPTAEQPQHLCLDAGYDYDLPRFAAEQRGYTAHIRPRGEERAHAGSLHPLKPPRRGGGGRPAGGGGGCAPTAPSGAGGVPGASAGGAPAAGWRSRRPAPRTRG